MYNVLIIARLVINICHREEIDISNLKLQKLLYFIQAEFLIERNENCFNERIEAWAFGPVVPEIYYRYRAYGAGEILENNIEGIDSIEENDVNIIEDVIDTVGGFSARRLVEITHRQAPWLDAYVPNENNEITRESIVEFFRE